MYSEGNSARKGWIEIKYVIDKTTEFRVEPESLWCHCGYSMRCLRMYGNGHDHIVT